MNSRTKMKFVSHFYRCWRQLGIHQNSSVLFLDTVASWSFLFMCSYGWNFVIIHILHDSVCFAFIEQYPSDVSFNWHCFFFPIYLNYDKTIILESDNFAGICWKISKFSPVTKICFYRRMPKILWTEHMINKIVLMKMETKWCLHWESERDSSNYLDT